MGGIQRSGFNPAERQLTPETVTKLKERWVMPGKATIFDFIRHRRVEHYGLITERTGVGAPLGKPEGA